MLCYHINGGEIHGEEWTRVSRWVEVGERQLGRMEEHVDLMCSAPASNLTQLLRSLWEDLGWKDEVTKVRFVVVVVSCSVFT